MCCSIKCCEYGPRSFGLSAFLDKMFFAVLLKRHLIFQSTNVFNYFFHPSKFDNWYFCTRVCERALSNATIKGQGTLTKGEGWVQLTSLYLLVWISCFLRWNHSILFYKNKLPWWKRINCKQSDRWQHLSQLKASAFFFEIFLLGVKKHNSLYLRLV